MKYFIITYLKKPNGQFDENVAVSANIKTKDLATANVILNFAKKEVVKCTMEGTVVKEWQRVRDFYYQYYPEYFNELEKLHAKQTNQ